MKSLKQTIIESSSDKGKIQKMYNELKDRVDFTKDVNELTRDEENALEEVGKKYKMKFAKSSIGRPQTLSYRLFMYLSKHVNKEEE